MSGASLEKQEWQPFRGWFQPVTDSGGRVLYYAQVGEPTAWMARETPPDAV